MASSIGANSPLVGWTSPIIVVDNSGQQRHYIQCYHDLDRINELLSSIQFIRILDPVQLPSQSGSTGPGTPTASVERRPANFEFNQAVLLPRSITSGRWRGCSCKKRWTFVNMAINQGYFAFEQPGSAHKDLVLAVDFNFYGNRMVTASSDHKLKVFDRKEDNWTLVDTWNAHAAEITDVKWNGPFMGEVFGSVGEDGFFRLWQENATEIPSNGRRFSCIFELNSSTKVPFMSLDFKNIQTETWIALATRDGFLTVLEPIDHENLTNWQNIYANYLVTTPDREDETSFKVAFHKEKLPSWTAVRAGLDRKSLSLAVASMNTVKVFRATKDVNSGFRFHATVELTGARALVRDVAWANGSMRGWDVIATASKDGCVRVYELKPEVTGSGIDSSTATVLPEIQEPVNNDNRGNRNAPSGIGAGLASGSGGRDGYRDAGSSTGGFKETAVMTEELNLHQGALWRVAFSQNGDVLVATGDDGAVTTWKRAMNGKWMVYAEVDVSSD